MEDSSPGTHVVYPHSDLGRWEMVIREPDPRLRAYIQSYQGYIESTTGWMRRLEPPSTTVVLIIGLGPALGVIDPRDQGRDDAAADHTSFVSGLYDSYVLIEARGTWQSGIQVNFTPLGAYQFLHLPMHLLSNRVIELDDLLGLVARRLVERLRETPSWEARFALLDAFISTRLAQGRAPTASVAWAWHKLHQADGCLGIGALAAELGCSQKHLITQFHEQIGLPPKTLARILRFTHALRHLEHSKGVRWSEIALECGYYDQAHFIRDFRAFTGSAPGDFLARRLPDGWGISRD
jgi:AraC-like DNA-binding protein